MKKILDKAIAAVLEAGELIRDMQMGHVEHTLKSDDSPVTHADKAAESLIRDRLTKTFPEFGFVGEEHGAVQSNHEKVWACDPVDGTWSFLNREVTCATSLALIENNEPILGVIYNPFTNELFAGAKGIPSSLNGHALPLVSKPSIYDGVVNFFIHRSKVEEVNLLYQLRQQKIINKMVSIGGSIAYTLANVAKGAHTVFIGLSDKPSNWWDISAGFYLIRSVGGQVTGLEGDPLPLVFPPFQTVVASSSPSVHAEILAVLNDNGFGKL